MELEEKKVQHRGLNILKSWRDKEWWYTGIHDPTSKIYFSFFFIRVHITDHFKFTLFDYGANPKSSLSFEKNIVLDLGQQKNRLSLNYRSKNLIIGYNGDEKEGWSFHFSNRDYNIKIKINPSAPPFTKHDNNFVNCYSLMHFFHNIAEGFIETPNKNYPLNHALCYYDHCFGRVPRKTRWHWIAVQNKDTALASLVNYGADSQKYTEVYFKENTENFKLNQWIRLNQEVSFEHYPPNEGEGIWKATSCDMDLSITPLMRTCSINKIPPIVPFIANLTHSEFFVKADGRVRVDSTWVEVMDLYGVMEEHCGWW
ncbi:MAG: DUF2804 family protein [Clostridia bacterium]|nr:DUF2804 family protein [Clostridia bacterium]